LAYQSNEMKIAAQIAFAELSVSCKW